MRDETDANLIRAYCDGELEPARAADVERRVAERPDVGAQVEFERRLRQRIAGVMAGPAPADLRDRVRAALRDDRMTLRGGTATPRRASLLAVAATLALVAGAVLYGIFGPRLDDQPLPQSGLVVDAYRWAATEHGRCASDDEVLGTKMVLRTPEEAARDLETWLRASGVRVFDLTSLGYAFAGAGHCMVPGSAFSGHVIYRRDDAAEHPPLTSLFIVPDVGQFEVPGQPTLSPGAWRESGLIEECRLRALQGTDGVLAYLLVCCDERDLERVAQLIGEQIQAPRVR